MALAEYALTLTSNPSKVIIVGQSLGGGLAGVVGSVLGLTTYAFAPAPFQNSIQAYAEMDALAAIYPNTTIDVSLMPPGMTGGFHLKTDEIQKNIIIYNGYSELTADLYLSKKHEFIATYAANQEAKLKIHTIQGETLSDGLGSLTALTGAQQFDVQRTSYNVGVPSGAILGSDVNTTITLHGSALHALVIRTHGLSDDFESLLKDDGVLRYGMLSATHIAAPMNPTGAVRQDDRDHSLYGGSGINADGASVTALFRTLWKTVGIENGLYGEFYARFGSGLSHGAVGLDKSGAVASGYSVHSGFVSLGLQTVRDGLDTSGANQLGANATALNVFGSELMSGGNYAIIDNGNISNNPENSKSNAAFDLDRVFIDQLISQSPSGITGADSALGFPVEQVTSQSTPLNWDIAVANSRNSTIYRPIIENLNKAHIFFGGEQADYVEGSNQKDYISTGGGNDIVVLSGGNDIINGGAGSDTVSYKSSVGGVNVSLMATANLVSIENLHGSDFDDILQGNSGNNLLIGGKGDDTFKGNGGNDVINGGEGNDTVIFDYTFSQMAIHEYYTGIETAFSFSPFVGLDWSQRITRVEQFVDSTNTVWSLADVRQAIQLATGPYSSVLDFLQSSAPEESAPGTVFGVVEVDLDSLPFANNERPGSFVISSDTLDWTVSGNVITFTLKAGINTDLDRSMNFSTPTLNASIGVMKEIYDQWTGLWHEAPGFTIGTAKFRIDDVYDDGLSEIIVGVQGHVQTTPLDRIMENAPVFYDSDVQDLRMEIYPGEFAGAGASPAPATSLIRITGDSFDRDDIVSARLTNDSDGYFKLIKFQNEEIIYGTTTSSIWKKPMWAIVLAKAGLDGHSAPRTVTVEMSDGTTTLTRDVVIQIGNVNVKPTDILFTPTPAATVMTPSSSLLIKYGGTFPETAIAVKESAPGQGLIKLSAVDPDTSLDSHVYSIVGTPSINAFSIVGDEIVLNRSLTAAEKETIYSLTIEAKDSGNLTVQKTIQFAVDVPDNGLVGTSADDVTTATAPAQSVVGREGKDTHGYQNAPGPVAIDAGGMRGTNGWANGAYYHSVEKIIGSAFPDQFRASPNSIGIFEFDGGDGQDTLDFGALSYGITVNLASGSVNYAGRTLVFTSVESVSGTQFADQLYGILGVSNFLSGGAGNDILYAGADGDFVFGGDGIDTVNYNFASGPMTINLAAGSAKLTNGTLTDLLLSVENAVGSSFDDLLIAGSGPNVLQGGFGNDVYDQVDLGDTVIEIVVPPGFPLPPGWNPGIDTIRTIATSWTLGSGIENLTGLNTGNSTLKGNELDNIVIGNSGSDTLYGYAGNDSLYGGGGGDYLIGGDGDDFLDGGAGNDIIDGGNGNDTVSYLTRGAVTVNLATGSATLVGETDFLSSIENVIGSGFADTITGTSGANRIRSGGGDDVIDAAAGNDIVEIDGGNVQVTLGAGDDIVLLTRGSSVTAHHVTIVDFVTGEDKIHLEDGAFVPTVPYLFQDDVNGNAYLEIQDYGVVTFLGRTAASLSTGDLILV